MEQRDSAREAVAVRRVVWVSFVIALVAYGFVGAYVLSADARPAGLPAWLWPVVAGALGFGSLLASGILQGGRRSTPTAAGTGAAQPPVAAALPVPALLGWALAEGVGIVGLVSLVLGGSVRALVVYLAAALVLLVLQRPE